MTKFLFPNPIQQANRPVASGRQLPNSAIEDDFGNWLRIACGDHPWNWGWRHLRYIRRKLELVTTRELKRLMIFMPPQHGKSMMCTVRYPVYRLVRDNKLRVTICCYNQLHANRFSRQAREIAQEHVPIARDARSVKEWYTPSGGGIRAAGVGTGITGTPIDLGIIDDPVKDRQDADSEVKRDAVWEWYKDAFTTRLQPGSPVILIQTRWHEDDLAGRILNSPDGKNWEVLSLPAEAKENDPLGRLPGEALCPERFTADELAIKRQVMGTSYYALYDQNPIPPSGQLIQRPWLSQLVPYAPVNCIRVRYWDKAATEGGGCYSVGVRVARDRQGIFYIEDVVRGQWSPHQRDQVMLATAKLDQQEHGLVFQVVEEEGGSGGVESGQNTVKLLAGFVVTLDRVRGDKTTRILPFASQAEAGNVRVIQAAWTHDWIEELVAFPRGKYRDQGDATGGAINYLSAMGTDPIVEAGYSDIHSVINQQF